LRNSIRAQTFKQAKANAKGVAHPIYSKLIRLLGCLADDFRG